MKLMLSHIVSKAAIGRGVIKLFHDQRHVFRVQVLSEMHVGSLFPFGCVLVVQPYLG